ncbi:MAG: choloylglycine hydrolase, partial [Methyloceanibacter sp.]
MRFGKLPALYLATTLAGATAFDAATVADACSRLLYETGDGSYIIARSMDWNDPMAATSLWVFPQGMQRDGGIGDNPLTWTSKHGSVITSF